MSSLSDETKRKEQLVGSLVELGIDKERAKQALEATGYPTRPN
jgi:hypothetical protein